MSTPAPDDTCTFTLAGFLLSSRGIGIGWLSYRKTNSRESPVFEFDAAVREISDGLRVRNHENRVPGGVQLAQQFQDRGLVVFIEIACRLIGQNEFRMIDQRARDGHALLL